MENIQWRWRVTIAKVKFKLQSDQSPVQWLGLSEEFCASLDFGVVPVFHAASTIWTKLNINVQIVMPSWVVTKVVCRIVEAVIEEDNIIS